MVYVQVFSETQRRKSMKIEIDRSSGFCFGVIRVIELAEKILRENGRLYCLGDIVHNSKEVERLRTQGLEIIDYEIFKTLKNTRVLIRAHGEPPETYNIASANNLELIDGTCPVVLKLQQRIKKGYNELKPSGGQIIIYGKKGHAEVMGLTGQTRDEAIVVETVDDLEKVDFSKPVHLFSQTTKSREGFAQIYGEMIRRSKNERVYVKCTDSICGQVANRAPKLRKFCRRHDIIIFVSGKKSSNGKILFEACRAVNSRTFFVSDKEELNRSWFNEASSTGICGATSTPMWLIEEIREEIKKLTKN